MSNLNLKPPTIRTDPAGLESSTGKIEPGYDSDTFDCSSINDDLQNFKQDPFEDGSISKNYSTSSSLQQFIDDNSDEYENQDLSHDINSPESISRPWSRNSTTSCLSTTATKDGVEGKRFHRHGPTPYSTSILANMVYQQQIQYLHQQQQQQHQQQQIQQQQQLPPPPPQPQQHVHHHHQKHFRHHQQYFEKPSSSTTSNSSFNPTPSGTPLRSFAGANEPSASQVSIKSTRAEFDGDYGDQKPILPTFMPQITLKEKINLLSRE